MVMAPYRRDALRVGRKDPCPIPTVPVRSIIRLGRLVVSGVVPPPRTVETAPSGLCAHVSLIVHLTCGARSRSAVHRDTAKLFEVDRH